MQQLSDRCNGHMKSSGKDDKLSSCVINHMIEGHFLQN